MTNKTLTILTVITLLLVVLSGIGSQFFYRECLLSNHTELYYILQLTK